MLVPDVSQTNFRALFINPNKFNKFIGRKTVYLTFNLLKS